MLAMLGMKSRACEISWQLKLTGPLLSFFQKNIFDHSPKFFYRIAEAERAARAGEEERESLEKRLIDVQAAQTEIVQRYKQVRIFTDQQPSRW